MNREAWLKWRRTGIGSSDSASVLGMGRRTKLHVQVEKLEGIVTVEETEAMENGRDMEPIILKKYERKTGLKARTQNKMRRSEKYPWMICTLDAIVPGKHPLEIKHIDHPNPSEWGQEGTDEIPLEYIIQGQHDLAVLPAEYIEFPVYWFGRLRLYRVDRNERLIAHIIESTREFWKRHIEQKVPVDPDFDHPETPNLLKRIYGLTVDKSIDLDNSVESLAGLDSELSKKESEIKQRRESLKAQILHAMGDAEMGFTPNGMILTRKEIHVADHSVKAFGYVRLYIKQPKEKKIS